MQRGPGSVGEAAPAAPALRLLSLLQDSGSATWAHGRGTHLCFPAAAWTQGLYWGFVSAFVWAWESIT